MKLVYGWYVNCLSCFLQLSWKRIVYIFLSSLSFIDVEVIDIIYAMSYMNKEQKLWLTVLKFVLRKDFLPID